MTNSMKTSRRTFLKKSAIATLGAISFSAKSYSNIPGSNDRVRVGVVGYSDRFRSSLLPCFQLHSKEMNFDIVAVSDIWRLRREEAKTQLKEKLGHDTKTFRNNDELYAAKEVDAVIISTADFQHALHGIEAVKAGCDAYIE